MNIDKPSSLREQIVTQAIWNSFCGQESLLSLHQLLLRRLTPTEAMSRECISSAITSGQIRVASGVDEPGLFISMKHGKIYFIAVQNSQHRNDREIRKTEPWSLSEEEDLLEFVFNLLSANVIEYAKYFALRGNIQLSNLDYRTPSLRVFFENLSLSQTFSLFWRSVKSFSDQNSMVNFSEVAVRANDFFEHYCRSGKEIKAYPRPTMLVMSQVEKVLFSDWLGLAQPDFQPNIYEYFNSSKLRALRAS